MLNNNKTQVLIAGAVVVREPKGEKEEWFLIKQSKDIADWELPKTVVRKGESSVRAVLRIMGEKGAMTVRVLEEVGRAGGSTSLGDKTVAQRQIFYLMLFKASAGEAVGFEDNLWSEYPSALKKITSKREQTMLSQARTIYKEWKKAREKRKKKLQEPPEEEEMEPEF
jgi:ADP-ribose pyrophosphatase YjhB (NUDIX family)